MKRNLNGRLGELVDELVTSGLPLNQSVQEFEKQYILAALRQNDGNLTRSAKSLGVHRNTLRNKVGKFGIRQGDIAPKKRRARKK